MGGSNTMISTGFSGKSDRYEDADAIKELDVVHPDDWK